MLENHQLLIDKNCPLCKAYGHCFTALKIVDNQTVSPYQDIEISSDQMLDMARAKNEIALHDKNRNHTIYGIDAMIKIVTHRHIWVKRILTFFPIYFLLTHLYNFISYNRKLIVPVKERACNLRNCNPDVNLLYRWLYIITTALFTGLVLNIFFEPIFETIGIDKKWWLEYLVCFGQIIWQGTFINYMDKPKTMDYLGNMSTVSTMGGILLIPMLLFQNSISSIWVSLIYFGLVVSFMFYEHVRRCKLLDISLLMSFSWVTYRIVVLTIFLILNT